ncbi:MAG: ABC transporter ATP-binding protein [Gemmatimonadaceae bacterium]
MTLAARLIPTSLPTARFSATGAPAIRIDGISKTFPERRRWDEVLRHPFAVRHLRVLQDVRCDVKAGEFFGVLGPNGAGKTTLFKTLMASITPTEGTASILGHDVVKEAAQVRRLVACVLATDRSLFWRLSATENLRLFASLHGMHGVERTTRIEEVLRAVQLEDVGVRIVAMFSTGMRQRLLIARALLSHPKILLLDEPTRSLDPISARGFREFLRNEIVDRQGCTVMLATHNSEEAMELCDRVAILDRGRLLAVGRTDELARRFGDQIFCIWTRNPHHPAFLMLDAEGRARLLDTLPADSEGWSCVRFAIPGEMSQAAGVLECLIASGVDVARFEQKSMALAELIERVVQSRTDSES